MSDRSDLGDGDDALLALLASTLDRTEPLDDGYAESVQAAAFASRNLDAELAVLVDTELTATRMRDDAGTRHVTFGHGDLEIDLSIDPHGLINGVITPFDDRTVILETDRGPSPIHVDDLGRFETTISSSRLRLAVTYRRATVVTPWLFR